MYKPGGTISLALSRIEKFDYVLPAIQREFVWKPEQIERLFDSLMQGYPFGTFLLWKIEANTSGKFKFYDFVRNYHERDAAHCPELPALHNQAFSAVLDGQQRLTALNIGLRGSMAMKQPNKWWTNPDAFPRKFLYLNLLAPTQPDEDGVSFAFRFLTPESAVQSGDELWFKVSEILRTNRGPDMLDWLSKFTLEKDPLKHAFRILDRLHAVVHTEPLVHYYEEEAQDVERVLNIFIRLNSGGTTLSYSDLLLSVAVAQWKNVDARAEIHRLVDELNRIGTGFSLTQDFVLKAGLMLADISSVGFKVENFTRENMATLEANWTAIRSALIQTVELAASFGLNGQTLRADSALLPIAYYVYSRKVPPNYIVHSKYANDRALIRKWLICSLLKASGIWGSGLDTLLTALRDLVKANTALDFPDAQLRSAMDTRGKSLSFSDAEVEDLLQVEYGDRRAFPLLSLIFDFVDLRNHFHVDHIFPISRFSVAKLRKAGFLDAELEEFSANANKIPNLQLLEGQANNEKRAKMPAEWLEASSLALGAKDSLANYRALHMIGDVGTELRDAKKFWDLRREQLRARIRSLLAT